MMSRGRWGYVLVAMGALYLQGCAGASPATAQGMALTPNEITGPAPSEMAKAVIVDDSVGRRESDATSGKIDNAAFKDALARSLRLAGLLGDTGGARYKVIATVIDVDQPRFVLGFDMTVTSKIRYRVTDSKTGAPLFDEEIVATDTGHLRDAGQGDARMRIATERSARKTIAALIEKLKTAKLPVQSASRSTTGA